MLVEAHKGKSDFYFTISDPRIFNFSGKLIPFPLPFLHVYLMTFAVPQAI